MKSMILFTFCFLLFTFTFYLTFISIIAPSANVIELADEEVETKLVALEKMKKEYKHAINIEGTFVFICFFIRFQL